MTQQPLCFDAPAKVTLTDRVAALFRAHPGQWIDALELSKVAGVGGWRTRKNECEHRYGMVIENRIAHWPDGRNRSQYRYLPRGHA